MRVTRLAGALFAAILPPTLLLASGTPTVISVQPSLADSRINRFDESSYALYDSDVAESAPLVVFLPGTGGAPGNSRMLLAVIAEQGYRVIGLQYNDEPAVIQACAQNPAAACSERFRARRAFGVRDSREIDDEPWESINQRLVDVLVYLRSHDRKAWGAYLSGREPNWHRIIVSGLSQGAGMAAYIAKKREVKRVVLFSGPWDATGSPSRFAPWLYEASATPATRWHAAYHRRENTASQIAGAYRALAIPSQNILVFDESLPSRFGSGAVNPYHRSTTQLIAYVGQWRTLFGCARSDESEIESRGSRSP